MARGRACCTPGSATVEIIWSRMSLDATREAAHYNPRQHSLEPRAAAVMRGSEEVLTGWTSQMLLTNDHHTIYLLERCITRLRLL
jgi:hypothetical protein